MCHRGENSPSARRRISGRTERVGDGEQWTFFDDSLSVRVGAATHVGKIRKVNEDGFGIAPGAYVVADGMGGHKSGDVASSLALEAVRDLVAGGIPSVALLTAVVDDANAHVRDHAASEGRIGMGSTLVGALVVRNSDALSVAVVNVGDSRCYTLVGGHFRQVTTDHSLVQEMVERGELTTEQARTHPDRNVVTRAIGIDESVAGDFVILPELPVSRLLLCSDGVHGELSDEAISSVLNYFEDPQEAADAVIARVLESPARDNATAVVVDVRRASVGSGEAIAEVTGPRPSTHAVPKVGPDCDAGEMITDVPAAVPVERSTLTNTRSVIDEVPR